MSLERGPNAIHVGQAYFDDLHRLSPDPWSTLTRQYEIDKRRAVLEALPHDRYQSALDVGCSVGTITRSLSSRCVAVLGIDFSEVALARASLACAKCPNVTFALHALPDLPPGLFDLVVLSEVLNYLSQRSLVVLAHKLPSVLSCESHVAMVHRKSVKPSQEVTWHAAHAMFIGLADMSVICKIDNANYEGIVLMHSRGSGRPSARRV